MAKRKTYETEHYLYLTNQLLKTIQQTPHLQPNEWNLVGPLPDDCELRFISSQFAHQFYLWEEFDCRTIKLINIRKPACRLTFFRTHRYFLKKADKITPQAKSQTIHDVVGKLKLDLDKLNTQTLFEQPTQQLKTIQQELTMWQAIAQNPDQYDIALSNYHKHYYYNTLNFKFLLPDKTSGAILANETVHLLKNQYEKEKQNKASRTVAQTRYNIVFIDEQAITQPDPYQNKVVHLYLEQFAHKTDMFLHHVYVRPLNQAQSSEMSIATSTE